MKAKIIIELTSISYVAKKWNEYTETKLSRILILYLKDNK